MGSSVRYIKVRFRRADCYAEPLSVFKLGPTAGEIFAPRVNVRAVINYAVVIPYYENQFQRRRRSAAAKCVTPHYLVCKLYFVTGRPGALPNMGTAAECWTETPAAGARPLVFPFLRRATEILFQLFGEAKLCAVCLRAVRVIISLFQVEHENGKIGDGCMRATQHWTSPSAFQFVDSSGHWVRMLHGGWLASGSDPVPFNFINHARANTENSPLYVLQ